MRVVISGELAGAAGSVRGKDYICRFFGFQEESFEWTVLSFIETGTKQYSRYIP